jgi:aminoglycoside phosphotransferase (APT) family kinase protein
VKPDHGFAPLPPAKTSDGPDVEVVARWLGQRVPPDPERAGVVHGDFKLDNVLLDANSPDRIVAVLDWEMSALGDPLVDLRMLLAYWVPSAPAEHRDALTTVTDRPGWLSREEVIEQYAMRTDRGVDALPYFEVFALFKIAVVLQQIYYRYAHGETDDQRFSNLETRVIYLARSALRLIERA